MSISFLVVFGMSWAAFSGSVFAHGGAFGEANATSGDFTMRLQYTPDEVLADEEVSVQFSLAKSDGAPVNPPFSRVFVRFDRGPRTEASLTLAANDFGTATILYRFPAQGEYTIHARFMGADGNALAEGDLGPIAVGAPLLGEKRQGSGALLVIGLITGVVLGVLGAGFFKKKPSTVPPASA